VVRVFCGSPHPSSGHVDSQKRKLGNLEVSAIGLGCMSMSFGYGPAGDKQDKKCILQLLGNER
jgi:hypothetical protein